MGPLTTSAQMSEPAGVTRVPEAARFTLVPAAYVFLLRGEGEHGEVLLQFRGRTGYMERHWAAAAAGHLERGETAYDAAHREASEEIGVTGLDLAFLTSMQRTRSGEAIDERIDFFFTARRWSGEPRIIEPAKCLELRWCRLDDLPQPVVPHERTVLQGLVAGLPAYTTAGFHPEGPGASAIETLGATI